MPVTKSAHKALSVATRRARENARTRARLKRALKGDDAKATQSIIDKAAKNHVIHRNKAARLKARLMKAKSS